MARDESQTQCGGPLADVISASRDGLGEDLLAVVLFGSRARGEASHDSDWDLLVVARSLPEKPFERRLYLKRLLPPGPRGMVSILARTPEEFEEHLPSLYLDIALDGIVLLDPQGYASYRLGAVRRLLAHLGLGRRRSDAGFSWHWESGAGDPLSVNWEAASAAATRRVSVPPAAGRGVLRRGPSGPGAREMAVLCGQQPTSRGEIS